MLQPIHCSLCICLKLSATRHKAFNHTWIPSAQLNAYPLRDLSFVVCLFVHAQTATLHAWWTKSMCTMVCPLNSEGNAEVLTAFYVAYLYYTWHMRSGVDGITDKHEFMVFGRSRKGTPKRPRPSAQNPLDSHVFVNLSWSCLYGGADRWACKVCDTILSYAVHLALL